MASGESTPVVSKPATESSTMTAEFETQEEPKDRTKFIWLGVVVLVAVMIGILWWRGRPNPSASMVHAKHILIEYDHNDPSDRARALDLITQIRERIMNGESFGALAREYSADPGSAARGGDLGYQQKGTFVPEFEAYVWSAPINQLSDVISTTLGFHLIVVIDRHLTEADLYEMELDKRAREALDQQKAESPSAPSP